ncbi:MAG TPA: HD domain-containing phosphohydrolase [Gaiellaceae bacterium]|nr:HD domain-containing phosphohydrolase [Gaiellaceae bacterium]
MVVRPNHLRLLEDSQPGDPTLVESYRRLADVFHEVLAEQSLDALLVRIADAVGDLIPLDTLTIYEADETKYVLKPVHVRDKYADEIMRTTISFAEGITGWAARNREAVLSNQAHLDPRVRTVPGTPLEPEALICIPLIARGQIKGALNIYREGDAVAFSETEFEIAKRFGDAAALALDNAEIRERLEHQARTDSLTGLFNHSVFHERLLESLQESSRTHAPLAVLMLDIDDFKRVNDVHGHAVGDELLRFLAEALRAIVRPEDAICRLGGEEFAVVMDECNGDDAVRVAERVQNRLAGVDFPGIGHMTVSVGLALGPEHAMNPRELAACAEAAMMTAKAQGKNQVVLYAEEATQRPDAPGIERDVRSIAHLKMLQSLTGKLNRLADVREIGDAIAAELRSLVDYHNCRVFVCDGDELLPVAFLGELSSNTASLSLDLLRTRVGEGITGRCAELGESIVVADAANCEFGRQIEGTDPIEESLLAVPLRYGTRVVGVIVVSKLGLDQFDEDDVRLLEVLAGHAAVAVENASLYDSARREAESATALLEFSRELAAVSGPEEIAEIAVDLAASIIGSSRTVLWLEDDHARLVPKAFHGVEAEDRVRLATLEIRTAQLDHREEPYFSRPADYEKFLEDPPLPGVTYAVAPFQLDRRMGCITAVVSDEDFGERELRLLAGIADQAKLALANAASYEGLEHTFVSTVEALANALEANDEYTSTHARWITDLSLRVGQELGLDERTLKRLELGALLHDIGKIGIPSDVLAKPGRLTAAERKLVQTHPELGERIIAPIDRLQSVRPIVRHCHERWDGRGYPDGVAGEDIPLESRIIFVCDAYHAMTSDRPYRRRLSHREAVRRLHEASGTQFDPQVVEVALQVLELPAEELEPAGPDPVDAA